MARLLRVQFPGAIYHVSVRGNERRLIFRDDSDRTRFLAQLAESNELYSARLFLVCLMPNHFHLLVETPGGNLSRYMARLITAYTVYYNKRHHRVGHLTQGRFAAQMVEGNEYLLKLSRYIHLNPVCGKRWRGVSVEQRQRALRAYRWSTYRSYAGWEAEWPWIDYAPLGALEGELAADYASYVQTGLSRDDPEFALLYRRARLSLGSNEFMGQVNQAHAEAVGKTWRPEDAALRQGTSWRSVGETLSAVAEVLGVSEESLQERRRGSLARVAAAWALVRFAGLTQRSVAAVLGMSTGAAVSHQIARWQELTVQEQSREAAIRAELEQRLRTAKY